MAQEIKQVLGSDVVRMGFGEGCQVTINMAFKRITLLDPKEDILGLASGSRGGIFFDERYEKETTQAFLDQLPSEVVEELNPFIMALMSGE